MTPSTALGALCALALSATAIAQDAAPEEPPPPGLPRMDIHLAEVTWSEDGTPSIGAFTNATDSPGYDNQPFFTPDGSAFLYSRENEAGGTDLWRYELATGETAPLLLDEEANAFSPTVPFTNEAHVLFLRQDAEGTQNVYVYAPEEDAAPAPLLDIHPVGYFALGAGGSSIALFVLGEPHELQVVEFDTGERWTAHADIGRAILSSPNQRDIHFTATRADGGYALMRLDPRLRSATPLFAMPGDAQDLAIHADASGTAIAGYVAAHDGALLYRGVADEAWRPVADLAAAGLEGATRVALSPSGDRIAVVAAEPDRD